MIQSRLASRILAIAAVGSFVLAPAAVMAFDDHHDRGHGKEQHDRGRGHDDHDKRDKGDKGNHGRGNNGKSPKDRGLHDNRDHWWKDDHRNRNDDWKRQAEQRRRAEEWRRSQERLGSSDWRRVDNNQRRIDDLRRESDHRQQTKNEWRNIAYVGGAVAVLGLLKHDKTLMFAGTAGALYSLYRYEQDRKSQSRTDHLRAEYFSRPYFVRDGRRYDRVLVTQNGQRYYQFRRH